MREPPLGLDIVPDENLEIFFDEILAAPTTAELLAGLYGAAIPALRDALQNHIAANQSSGRRAFGPPVPLRVAGIGGHASFGPQCLASLVDANAAKSMAPWLSLLDDCLAAAGGLDGPNAVPAKGIARHHSRQALPVRQSPARDERFPDPYNMGVNAEVFLYDEPMPPDAKVLMMFYKRLREIDVPEMMASIIAETPGKPWGYYRDMTRQLWDEARHAMMGEVGFASVGVDWPKQRHDQFHLVAGFEHATDAHRTPRRPLFHRAGPDAEKRQALRMGSRPQSHNPLCALFQDYDWADEVLHARIGRDWYLKEFKNASEAIDYGDKCWSKVLAGWRAMARRGPDPASQLVARLLSRRLPERGHRCPIPKSWPTPPPTNKSAPI
jgi:hypothetical protein